MGDALRSGTTLGYGTNVHPGSTLPAVKANLEQHATAVRRRVAPEGTLPIGLWLAAPAAAELAAAGAADFAEWLAERRLEVFTINGFPAGDFHAPVVKHRVYAPDWTSQERLAYTLDLLVILAALRPEGEEGSISTLPIGWPGPDDDEPRLRAAAENLRDVARVAAMLEEQTGRLLHVDLEPEPGCLLERGADIEEFFARHLLGGDDDAIVRRHLRVCHDICHAAVMFEDQAEILRVCDEVGISIGKVQVSNAVRVDFDRLDAGARAEALAQLGAFGEERYLHQTMIRASGDRAAPIFHDDLPRALEAVGPGNEPAGEWRVHYHVPVFLERFGYLETTRDEITTCLDLLRDWPEVLHYEVETYAWEVLPPALRRETLADGIAEELTWVGGL